MTAEIDTFDTRRLQIECARVLAAGDGFSNTELVKFNSMAHHDSQAWYRAVIAWYVEQYGGLPSEIGPGTQVNILLGNDT